MFKNEENSFAKIQLTITLVLVLLVSITGATYAYFAIEATNNNTITGNMATVDLTLSVTRIFPTASDVNTSVMVPQLSNNSALGSALKGKCVDQNKNVACQVYKIVIQNAGGSATQVVDGKVSFYSDAAMTTDIGSTMPNLKWRLITSANVSNPTNSVLGNNSNHTADATDTPFVSNLQMETDSIFTYYMIIWINEINTNQEDQSTETIEKSFYGKITFDSSNGTGVTSSFES